MYLRRQIQNLITLSLVFIGPILAAFTVLTLGPLNQNINSTVLRLILLADLFYILLVAALVLRRVMRIMAERRLEFAGSRLHLRLSGVFAFLALMPTILVAIFAVFTVNFGLEGWFSERVRNVVGSSLAAAQAYEDEHRKDLTEDALSFAYYINSIKIKNFLLPDDQLRPALTVGQTNIQRGLKEAYLIDGTGLLHTRGEKSYLFDFEQPSTEDITRAKTGETVIIEDWTNNEFRALIYLKGFADRYLYVSRVVDGSILSLLDETKQTARLYHQLEADRGRLLFEFGLLYLGFAIILILAATWLGLWFAERLSRPVGRLAEAAMQVGDGNLNVRVPEGDDDDEISMLGQLFNKMTHDLKGQRDALIAGNTQTERRRRLFDSVLSSITSGVIGLDGKGRVTFVNRAASRLLDFQDEGSSPLIQKIAPEFSALFERQCQNDDAVQEELRLMRNGRIENLLVRMAVRQSSAGQLEGYVVTFDDVTDLVSAQRMAAWGDVARRIAHEIKNPLTPIQLSAERIKRKFRPLVGDQADNLDQYADVIIRQTNDLRRIVDDFSKFARMPEPQKRTHDLTKILNDAVLLQEVAMPQIALITEILADNIWIDVDQTMMSQALMNLIKNASEAIDTYIEKFGNASYEPEIFMTLNSQDNLAILQIMDNGIGLPPDRGHLFEPYVTMREKGTGLGLSIVKKIIEEHGGTLNLQDAPIFASTRAMGQIHFGAMVEIRLPLAAKAKSIKIPPSEAQ
ncbi:MAG: PAS domain-containing sensor histidine kinase [Proteobacteria bacterium]|nr:PAS domain-containing sensor histidine kinase [Pseudomonadota bacterium]